MPHRLEQPLGTCTKVVRSSNAGSSMRDSRIPWLYGERAGASRSPLEGFWEAEMSVKDGGLVIFCVSKGGVRGSKGGGMTTPDATKCMRFTLPMRADLKYP